MSKSVVPALSAAVAAALLGTASVASAGDLFRVDDLGFGYRFAGEEHAEGKCGEGKCGGAMKAAADDEKVEAKTEATEGKCGEGKCGEAMKGKVDAEGKCGEGKCGEGKCGGDKQADPAPK